MTKKDSISSVHLLGNLVRLSIFLSLISATSVLAQSSKSPGKSIFASNRSAANALRVTRPSTPPPRIIGKAAIVIDARTGKALYAKRADEKRPVASTQKLLTALLSLEKGHMNESVTVSKSDTWVEPSKIYIQSGQTYRKSDLIAALLVRSGNDVARCLARNHSGSQEAFAHAMNAKARRLGMNNSNFKNPHGLTATGQYSTARDIGILARAAYYHRTIRSITRIKRLPFRFANGKKTTFNNTNKLLHRSKYCNGLKTGYTNASGKCLISSGKNGHKEIIVVILGSNSSNIWNDSEKLLHWGLGIKS
ncbi:MAG TPA: D-alanyl-D-alanine carboxypeptidase [Verrucomicrobiales bacterium]|nr:D-alanyl-D-alanine carboxypeptidase [Verrucomicrobiales bacterium]